MQLLALFQLSFTVISLPLILTAPQLISLQYLLLLFERADGAQGSVLACPVLTYSTLYVSPAVRVQSPKLCRVVSENLINRMIARLHKVEAYVRISRGFADFSGLI